MARAPAVKPVIAEPGRPLFLSVKDAVRAAVDAGRFIPGERLPSTKALSVQLQVSLVTVHRALQELVSAGVLRRGQGRGTFVHEGYFDRAQLDGGLRFGLVFHAECSLADSYHGQVLEGVRRGANAVGADLVLLRFGEDWRNECHGFLYVNPFRDQLDRAPRFAGARRLSPGRAPAPDAKNPPAVVVGASWDHPDAWTIDSDNLDIARQAVQHLLHLGHHRLCYLGATEGTSNNMDRLAGFRAALAEAGLPQEDAVVLAADTWRLDDDEQAELRTLLSGPDRPTAIFAAGYYLALDAFRTAAACGLTVPSDLSVVGVDDPPSAALLSPPLTTVRQPLLEMGELASRTLLELIGDPTRTPRRTHLKGQLIVRRSTGHPLAAADAVGSEVRLNNP